MKNLPSHFDFAASDFISSYKTSISSDGQLIEADVENRLCQKTGNIYNVRGTRENTKAFYTDVYDLHNESVLSEFQYFENGLRRGYYDSILDFILESVNVSSSGSVLDIGCGKGLLLSRFQRSRPNWSLHAVEPSRNALGFFAQVMPRLSVFNGNFEDSPFVHQKFDLIMSNGVLEHVPDPFHFMQSVASCMKPGGFCYIGVPNFVTNPVDLFTYDHLTRFTPDTIRNVFSAAGLEPIAELSPSERVPMWYLLKKSSNVRLEPVEHIIEQQRNTIANSLSYLEKVFNSFNRCTYDNPMGKIVVYGTGAIVNLGFKYSNLRPDLISYVVDDNSTLWGASKFGVKVISLEELFKKNVDAVVFSANPCYLPRMLQNIKPLSEQGAQLYLPE